MRVLLNLNVMTLEKFKELDQTHVLVSSVETLSVIYAIKRETLMEKKIVDLGKEPVLEQAYMVHPFHLSTPSTLSTDDLNILYIDPNNPSKITKRPLKNHSKH